MVISTFTNTLLFSQPANAEIAEELIYDYTDEGGAYYIRTIIHFSNLGTNPNDDALYARAKNIMDYINSVYNPYGIYFVAVSSCNGNPVSYDCPLPLVVPYVLENFTSFEPPSTSRCASAIDIFDVGDGGAFLGDAFSEPNTYLRSGGSFNNIPATLSPNLIHEIGHCLGLLHTYVGFYDNINGTPDACEEDPSTCWNSSYPNIDPCICCEDNVCDTKLTPNELVINSSCQLVSHQNWTPPLTDKEYRNYMSGATSDVNLTSQTQLCFNRFTSGQVARMRAYLRSSTTLNPVQLKTTAYSGTLPGGVYGNIVVKSGQTLEITSPVEMLPGASIRVEKGALLEVKSTVTVFGCDGLWRGIIVDGEVGLSQTTQNQGKVKVNYPDRIEHARIGIDVQSIDSNDEPIDGTGGGIITVLSGKFFNCITGIRYGEYKAIGAANISYLIGAEFTVNDDYRSEERPTLLDLTAITMLNIATCKLQDLRNNCGGPLSRAVGIDSKNASFRVSYNSSFRNLRFGIRADKLAALSGSYSVSSSSFTGCYRGISSNNFSSFRIIGNDFEVRMPDGCQAGGPEQKEVKGVELMGNAAGFGFYRNSFFYNGTALPDETLIGTDVIDLEEGMNNVIRENDYSNLHVGNRAMGYNGYAPPGDGLVYLCNTINDYSFSPAGDAEERSNYLIAVGSTIRKTQGITIDANNAIPTGNKFSEDAYSFQNLNLSDTIDYYYYENDQDQDPTSTGIGYTGVTLKNVNFPNSECPLPPIPPCDPCTTLTELNLLKNHFYQVKQQWLDRKAELPNITDTTELKAKIDTLSSLRLEMNKGASRVLRHYEQDTVFIEVDTILAWLERSETYPADLHLTSHYFFTKDFDAFDTLWSQIPARYGLQDARLASFNELGLVYATVRQHLEAGGALNKLPNTVVDSLLFWADWCSQPGFLAQILLWRNGIETEPDCTGEGLGDRSSLEVENIRNRVNPPYRIYPNPANYSVTVEVQEELGNGKISLYNLQGNLLSVVLFQSSSDRIELPTSQFNPGIYFLEIRASAGAIYRSKIIISH